jgi:choline dehydrogenase
MRNARDPKFTYQLRNGSTYHGLSPPDDATPKGFFYPRTAALGGCANHNAMIMALPRDGDWNELETLTGDGSWRAASMRTYFERLEHCQYVARGSPGHGYEGWLSTNRADPKIFLSDSKVFWMLKAAASIAGATLDTAGDLLAILSRDLNARSVERGTERGLHVGQAGSTFVLTAWPPASSLHLAPRKL